MFLFSRALPSPVAVHRAFVCAAALTAACATGEEADSGTLPIVAVDAGADLGATVGGGTPGGGTPGSGNPSGTIAGGGSIPGGTPGGTVPGGTPGGGTPGGGSDGGTIIAPPNDGGLVSGDGGGSVGADLFPLSAPLPTGKPYQGWTWVDVPGALCRDGSPAGYYYRRGKEAPLLIFLNGGGACSDPFFCSLNPANVNQNLPTESLIDATGNTLLGPDQDRQFPDEEGIFKRDMRNPVGSWNMVYVPYCTGDVFGGNKPDGTVPGVSGKHQFVGYKNMGLFLDSFGPSFAKAGKVLLSGSSAGGFGTLLNYDRTQIFFDKFQARVYGITDSGITFRDKYLAPCLQKLWRQLWNLDAALPKDCKGCFNADGGGLGEGVADYLFHQKYKDRAVGGMISSVEDGVIRAFFGSGLGNCTNDPGTNTILSALNLGGYSGADYRAGLNDITTFVGPAKVSTYFLDSWVHMHLWRARYYESVGGMTLAQWVGNVINDKVTHIGMP